MYVCESVPYYSKPDLYLFLHCCIDNLKMEDGETNETLKYVLSKYEEVEMKIIGEPINVYGLRLTRGAIDEGNGEGEEQEEEINIHFKYIDNTLHDIIQNCVFVLTHRPGECEIIRTVCNTFLPITPRPLLKRSDLRVCDQNVQLVEREETEESVTEAVKVEEEQRNSNAKTLLETEMEISSEGTST